jgi:hypothetical protein
MAMEHIHATQDKAVLLAAYAEICKSYHAIDDYRTKLLGFLPLTSLVGLLLLDPGKLALMASGMPSELMGFAGIFAAALTITLFGYELRGMQRTDHLITEGIHLEQQLGLEHGHFHVCSAEHKNAQAITRIFNAKFLAAFIYSIVFAAWLFIALRFVVTDDVFQCAIAASLVGLVLALAVCWMVNKLIPA